MSDTETLRRGKVVGIIFGIILAIGAVITAFAGVAFMGISDEVSEAEAQKAETYIQTKATIVNIVRTVRENHIHSDNNYEWHVYVEYPVDGIKYNAELNYYESSMYEGQTVTISYNPENPKEITFGKLTETFTSAFTVIGIGIIILGVITFVAGIVIAIKCFKSYKELSMNL